MYSSTRVNTGKSSWRIIDVLVSCQGVFVDHHCRSELLQINFEELPDTYYVCVGGVTLPA